MDDRTKTAALLGAGSVAALVAAQYVPKARLALLATAGALGAAAIYNLWKAGTASKPGQAGGLLGAGEELVFGAPIEAGETVLVPAPTVGGIKLRPGKVTAPSGQTFDGIDPLNLAHAGPVKGLVLTPPEGGSITRAAFGDEYLARVQVENRTNSPITGTLEIDITEDRGWLEGGARTAHASSAVFTVPAGETVVQPVVVPVAPSALNNVIMFPAPARMAVTFAGFVIATRNYRVQ